MQSQLWREKSQISEATIAVVNTLRQRRQNCSQKQSF